MTDTAAFHRLVKDGHAVGFLGKHLGHRVARRTRG
jgi:hypothetical protein